MLDKFVSNFTDYKVKYVKVKDKYFLENKNLEKNRLNVKEDLFGLYLGKEINNKFKPSFNLLDIIAKKTTEKIFVNDRGELDFLYAKDLRERHVQKIQGKNTVGQLKLVQNSFDENLGYGILVAKKGTTKVLKHMSDLGVFIKRDKQMGKMR